MCRAPRSTESEAGAIPSDPLNGRPEEQVIGNRVPVPLPTVDRDRPRNRYDHRLVKRLFVVGKGELSTGSSNCGLGFLVFVPRESSTVTASAAEPYCRSMASADSRSRRNLLDELRHLTGLEAFAVERFTFKVFDDESSLPPWVPDALYPALNRIAGPVVVELPGGLTVYATLFPSHEEIIAVGFQLERGRPVPPGLIVAAGDAGWSRRRLDRWIAEHPRCSPGPLRALLGLAFSQSESRSSAAVAYSQIDQLTEQLDLAYEEVALLHSLTRNLQASRPPDELADLCLSRMPELIAAQGHIIHLHAPGEAPATWVSGELPLADRELSELLQDLQTHAATRPIVMNHLSSTPLAKRFPSIDNLVAAQVRDGKRQFGWIASFNMRDDREFGTVEANFLNTLATILGTHVRNKDLLREQNDLLLGFVRSFVSTLDAKDPYTRGHSERVALIARCLGRELGLSNDDLKTIHLSGLLHDIGKIGVDDRILRKNGGLTDEEFEQIKRHPMIGYKILAGLKNLRHVLPGVRSHHENYDGSGYPDGLAGERIPLLARILAVADGYDAMGSDRPYRKGMPIEKIERIFREGAGSQWDPAVLDAYFRCRDDIRSICTAYSLESGCPLEDENPQAICS